MVQFCTELASTLEQELKANGAIGFEDFDISQNAISSEGFEEIFMQLRISEAHVDRFRAFGCPTFDDSVASMLAAWLAETPSMSMPLELHLSDNAITSTGFTTLAAALEKETLPKCHSQDPSRRVPTYVRLEHNFIDTTVLQARIDKGSVVTWKKTDPMPTDPQVKWRLVQWADGNFAQRACVSAAVTPAAPAATPAAVKEAVPQPPAMPPPRKLMEVGRSNVPKHAGRPAAIMSLQKVHPAEGTCTDTAPPVAIDEQQLAPGIPPEGETPLQAVAASVAPDPAAISPPAAKTLPAKPMPRVPTPRLVPAPPSTPPPSFKAAPVAAASKPMPARSKRMPPVRVAARTPKPPATPPPAAKAVAQPVPARTVAPLASKVPGANPAPYKRLRIMAPKVAARMQGTQPTVSTTADSEEQPLQSTGSSHSTTHTSSWEAWQQRGSTAAAEAHSWW